MPRRISSHRVQRPQVHLVRAVPLAVLLVGLLTLSPARSAHAWGEPEAHEGMYLRIGWSGGWADFGSEQNDTPVGMTGFGNSVFFHWGGIIADWFQKDSSQHLTLHMIVVYNALLNGTASAEQNGEVIEGPNKVDWGGIVPVVGLGTTYFLAPSHISLSTSVGLYAGSYGELGEDKIDVEGLLVDVMIAKEFWISENWSFGLGLHGIYVGAMEDPDSKGTVCWSAPCISTPQDKENQWWNGFYGGGALMLTYN